MSDGSSGGWVLLGLVYIAVIFVLILILSAIVFTVAVILRRTKKIKRLPLPNLFLISVAVVVVALLSIWLASEIRGKINDRRFEKEYAQQEEKFSQCVYATNPPGTQNGSFDTSKCDYLNPTRVLLK